MVLSEGGRYWQELRRLVSAGRALGGVLRRRGQREENGQPDEEKINTLRGLVKPLNEVFIELPYDAIKKILDKSLGLNQENNENNGQNTGTGMSGLNNN